MTLNDQIETSDNIESHIDDSFESHIVQDLNPNSVDQTLHIFSDMSLEDQIEVKNSL